MTQINCNDPQYFEANSDGSTGHFKTNTAFHAKPFDDSNMLYVKEDDWNRFYGPMTGFLNVATGHEAGVLIEDETPFTVEFLQGILEQENDRIQQGFYDIDSFSNDGIFSPTHNYEPSIYDNLIEKHKAEFIKAADALKEPETFPASYFDKNKLQKADFLKVDAGDVQKVTDFARLLFIETASDGTDEQQEYLQGFANQVEYHNTFSFIGIGRTMTRLCNPDDKKGSTSALRCIPG